MASTVAQNQADVDQMLKKDRLWDSMEFTYGTARDDIVKNFEQARAASVRERLGRGMQRSSYGEQINANLYNQGIDQLTRNKYQQIADYENRLTDLENTEWQQNFQQSQFDYEKDRDDRNFAASIINTILASGGTPSSELLARAGISPEDYAQMRVSNNIAGGGGGNGTNKPKPNEEQKPISDQFLEELANGTRSMVIAGAVNNRVVDPGVNVATKNSNNKIAGAVNSFSTAVLNKNKK